MTKEELKQEAEEYARRNNPAEYGVRATHFTVLNSFKDGAEYGYNKGYHDAEEHYMNVIDSQHKLVEESKEEEKKCQFKRCMKCTDGTYQFGFNDGYNKANEWHYVKDGDLPKECKGKLYLVNIYSDSQLKFKYAKYTPTVCLWNPEWKRFEILELTVGSRIVNIRDVIAWKEIVLPKESE